MPQTYVTTILTSIFAYIFALVFVRLVGRKTMSQITFFDFVLGVSLGTITANIALGPNRSTAILVLAIFVLLTVFSDYLHIKSFAMRKLIDSEPDVKLKSKPLPNGKGFSFWKNEAIIIY